MSLRIFSEEVTLEPGGSRVMKTEWEGDSHYRFRVAECPPCLAFEGVFTRVTEGGFDYITSTITARKDAPAGTYAVAVDWGWSDAPITHEFGYTLRLAFEVRVVPC